MTERTGRHGDLDGDRTLGFFPCSRASLEGSSHALHACQALRGSGEGRLYTKRINRISIEDNTEQNNYRNGVLMLTCVGGTVVGCDGG